MPCLTLRGGPKGMINLMVGLPDQHASSRSATLNKQIPPVSSQSFDSQLSEAKSQVLSKFGIDPSSVQLTVQDSNSGKIATSQNSAAASTQLSTSVFSPLAPQKVAALASAPVSALASAPVSAPVSAPASAPVSAPASTPASPPQSVDDAYWSKQPAAVQQLRNIQDQGQRTLLGAQLAAEGYSIDV